MGTLVWNHSGGRPAPELPPIFAVKTQHNKFVSGIWVSDTKNALGLVLRFGKRWIHNPGVNGGEDENLVAPDNWGGGPEALDLNLPSNIIFFTPFDRRFGGGRDSGGIGPSPVMPVGVLGNIGGV